MVELVDAKDDAGSNPAHTTRIKSMIRLYTFQEELIIEIKLAMISGHKNILVQSPTGSGKTVVFSSIVYGAEAKGRKCLILTDRIELLTGSEGTLAKFGIKTTNILQGSKYPPKAYNHCIAMSQTLRRRLNKQEWLDFISTFDIVIIDEAHIQEFNIYFEKDAFKSVPFILGFTATPKRLKKQRQLKEDYTKLIIGPQVQELIEEGFLVEDKYYAPRHFDTSKLKINSFGDFKESDMFKKIEHSISYQSVIDNWKKIANNSKTLVFCVNIEHTMKMCAEFNKNNIKAKFITSSISKPKFDINFNDEQFIRYQQKKLLYETYCDHMSKYSGNRHEVISEWKNGKFNVLVNTGIYTKGYDYKPLETVIVLRATTSETLWLQMIGRGSRIYENKSHFNILDFGSNAERLGLYKQDREWVLDGNYSTSEGVAPVKECGIIRGKEKKDKNGKDGCGSLILASRKICNYCGYVFEQEKVEIDVDLIQIEYGEPSKSKYNGIDFARLERQAEERGYKFGWVINRIIAEGGYDAVKAFRDYKEYKSQWLWRVKKQYRAALDRYEEKMRNSGMQEQDKSERLLF